MRRLGAIIAGGSSSRFASDKAAYVVNGRALLDHVVEALHPHVAAIVVAGRQWPGLAEIEDRPHPSLGPLGGLCGALSFASQHGFDGVITAGCDALPVLVDQILGTDRPLVIASQPLIGWWPVGLASQLDVWLASSQSRSVYRWAAAIHAELIEPQAPIHNLNTPTDVATWIAAGAPGA
jgi:molybdenum cofactor guanylyltransferase